MQKGKQWLGSVLATSVLLAAGCRQQPATPAQPAVQTASPAAIQIGGEDVLTLARKATNSGSKPEFLSVTLLPGRGMNMFQVTAAIPGKGEIPLLHSPSITRSGEPTQRRRQRSAGQPVLQFWRSLPGSLSQPHPGRTVFRWQVGGHAMARPHTLSAGELSQQAARRTHSCDPRLDYAS